MMRTPTTHTYTIGTIPLYYQVEDFFNKGLQYFLLTTCRMQLTSIIKNAANSTACTLCVCREAFDKWSPVPLIDIVLVVALLWSMDFLVKRWVRMSRASEGNIFMAKPEPGKKLPLNWDYIGTLDNNTKKNFHRLIAVTDDRLKFASYYKMKDYPVLLLFYSSKNKYFLQPKTSFSQKLFPSGTFSDH